MVKSDLRNGTQEDVRRSVIRERLADVNEMVHVSRTKNKTGSELKWIFPDSVLAVPGSFGSLPSQAVDLPKKMKQVGLS